jgi:hypothetical protein
MFIQHATQQNEMEHAFCVEQAESSHTDLHIQFPTFSENHKINEVQGHCFQTRQCVARLDLGAVSAAANNQS